MQFRKAFNMFTSSEKTKTHPKDAGDVLKAFIAVRLPPLMSLISYIDAYISIIPRGSTLLTVSATVHSQKYVARATQKDLTA